MHNDLNNTDDSWQYAVVSSDILIVIKGIALAWSKENRGADLTVA